MINRGRRKAAGIARGACGGTQIYCDGVVMTILARGHCRVSEIAVGAGPGSGAPTAQPAIDIGIFPDLSRLRNMGMTT